MSSICKKCGNEMPKDRQGHEQVCPRCLSLNERIGEIWRKYGCACDGSGHYFREDVKEYVDKQKQFTADITALIEEASDAMFKVRCSVSSDPVVCGKYEADIRADERKKCIELFKGCVPDEMLHGSTCDDPKLEYGSCHCGGWAYNLCRTEILSRIDSLLKEGER